MDCLTFMYSKAKACFKNTYIDCQRASAIVKTFPWLSEILIVILQFMQIQRNDQIKCITNAHYIKHKKI